MLIRTQIEQAWQQHLISLESLPEDHYYNSCCVVCGGNHRGEDHEKQPCPACVEAIRTDRIYNILERRW